MQQQESAKQSAQNGRTHPARRRGRLRVWPEKFLLALGLGLLAIYGGAWCDRILAAHALQEFTRLTTPASARKPNPGVAMPGAGQKPQLRPVIVRKPGDPVGVLRIARIHLEVPVLEGTSALTLNRAAGRIEGTAQPGEDGNLGIAGHRDSFFRGLRGVRVGDAIEFGTPAGASVYVVNRIQIVTLDRVDLLQSTTHPTLTLVTCYPFDYFGRAPRRYVVTAVLAEALDAPSTATPAGPDNPVP